MTNTGYTQLIEFLGRKFEEIDRRFDRVDAKLAEHDERFREVFGHFDHLYHRLERLEQKYQAILDVTIRRLLGIEVLDAAGAAAQGAVRSQPHPSHFAVDCRVTSPIHRHQEDDGSSEQINAGTNFPHYITF